MSQSNSGRQDPLAPHTPIRAYVAAAPVVEAERRAAILPFATMALATLPGVLVSTCHRIELYSSDATAAAPIGSELVSAGMTELDGDEAAHAVIALALGLRSAVLGEDQVLHQLRG